MWLKCLCMLEGASNRQGPTRALVPVGRRYYAPMLRMALGILFCSVALVACGGEETKTTSTQEVVDHFRTQTGESLIVGSEFSKEGVDELDLGGKDPSGQLTEEGYRLGAEFGAFSIRVFEDPSEAEEDAEYISQDDKDQEVTASGEPDENGIYWTKTCYLFLSPPDCSYSATKLYGSNVVLSWQGGGKQETDESWDRLNTSLMGLFE